MDSLRCLPVRLIGLEFELGVNAPDDQDATFDFNFAHALGNQALVRSRDLTRLQRASKGAGESAGGGRNDVVQCRRVRFQHVWRDLVVFGNRAVYSKNHWLRFGRQIRPAHRPFHTLDSDLGTVHDVGHSHASGQPFYRTRAGRKLKT